MSPYMTYLSSYPFPRKHLVEREYHAKERNRLILTAAWFVGDIIWL